MEVQEQCSSKGTIVMRSWYYEPVYEVAQLLHALSMRDLVADPALLHRLFPVLGISLLEKEISHVLLI